MDDMNFPWPHPVPITGKEEVDKTQPGNTLIEPSVCAVIHETWGLSQTCFFLQCTSERNIEDLKEKD